MCVLQQQIGDVIFAIEKGSLLLGYSRVTLIKFLQDGSDLIVPTKSFSEQKKLYLLSSLCSSVMWNLRKFILRPNPHRTQDAMRNATQANGTCWCEWGCPHCIQATLKEKLSNLRARGVPRPVWIGPYTSQSLALALTQRMWMTQVLWLVAGSNRGQEWSIHMY